MAALLCLVALVCLCPSISAYIVGGAVMPHGALTLDPRNFNGSDNATESANSLHYSALATGRFVQSLEADIILLLTPHGLALPEPFVLYNNPSAAGNVDLNSWLPCTFAPCTYNASVQLDTHLTKRLAAALVASGNNVTTLSGFGPPGEGSLPMPLAWGEVIPLYFIQRAYNDPDREAQPGMQRTQKPLHSQQEGPQQQPQRRRRLGRRLAAQAQSQPGSSSNSGIRLSEVQHPATTASDSTALPNFLLLSMPSRRYQHSVSMVPELLALGKALFAYLDSLDARIAVLVSGDLAHTWDSAGPYGFSEQAAQFDAAVLQWARDLDRDALLKAAAKSVGEAKSCGFPGMVVLQGILDQVKPDNMHSVLLEYGHPSYYGMMCAVFDFQGDA
ncbi:hypothetical protein Agub_g9671 [Astrephomene gubernaculifera]|uniref:Extradiol ring-cleavage dioxygenase class III enzyme subunit B domain-containing protein n=1 Tax=Astrephomene gubernaculifera TaxID=47775 RepID=A0AAD3DWB1_9CHLO|nr:hypothetical protein Agub_g9671 [Astrephomene gubernaculifera]